MKNSKSVNSVVSLLAVDDIYLSSRLIRLLNAVDSGRLTAEQARVLVLRRIRRRALLNSN